METVAENIRKAISGIAMMLIKTDPGAYAGWGGGLGHAPPPWAPKAPFATVQRPPIANVFTGKI